MIVALEYIFPIFHHGGMWVVLFVSYFIGVSSKPILRGINPDIASNGTASFQISLNHLAFRSENNRTVWIIPHELPYWIESNYVVDFVGENTITGGMMYGDIDIWGDVGAVGAKLNVFDLSDRKTPIQSDYFGMNMRGYRFDTTNKNRLFSVRKTIIIWDVSDPYNIVSLGELPTDFCSTSESWIVVDGDLAYASCRMVGFFVFNVSDSTSPVQISNDTDQTSLYNVEKLEGTPYVFSADWSNCIVTNDLTDPYNPVTCSIKPFTFQTVDISIDSFSETAFLAAGVFGVKMYDIENPCSPIPIGGFDTSNANKVSGEGDYVFVGNSDSGVDFIDVSTPSNMVLIKSILDGIGIVDVVVRENYLYVVHSGKLQIYGLGDMELTVNPVGEIYCGNYSIFYNAKDGSGNSDYFVDPSTPGIRDFLPYFNITFENQCHPVHGTCNYETNVCECVDELLYFGSTCSGWKCFEVEYTNEEFVCNSHGSCISANNCSCDEGWSGTECERWSCFNISMSDTENVCGGSGHGACVSENVCDCSVGYFHSSSKNDTSSNLYGPCTEWFCGTFDKNDVNEVCSGGRGNCSSSHKCDCEKGYSGDLCEKFYCGIYEPDDAFVCNRRGKCISPHFCDCGSGYNGSLCEEFFCGEIPFDDVDQVCNYGSGECVSSENCVCNEGYSGDNCEEFRCGLYSKIDLKNVCNFGNGRCVSPHKCVCYGLYEGDLCDEWNCGLDDKNDVGKVCSGNGRCMGPHNCLCNENYSGKDCGRNILYSTVMAPLLGVFSVGILFLLGFFVVVMVCFACCCCCALSLILLISFSFLSLRVLKQQRGIKRFSMLKNFDLFLREQEMEEDTSIAHLTMDKKLFEIPFDEIETIQILGEGGSNSVVFEATWQRKRVAFKCFKTRSICSSQDRFDEFEREVRVMANLSHPHVIRFYGATMKPPRVGIVMEYCVNGEMLPFFQSYFEMHGKKYPLLEKIRMLHQISSSFEYLHSRNVIHRDLKTENVLVDEKEDCKLMDFGLSRIIDRMSVQKTMRIGTSVYMAPEIVSGDGSSYDEKCDVFSYGILMWVVLTENEKPYDGNEFRVEIRVAKDKDFRPNVEEVIKSISDDDDGQLESYEDNKYIVNLSVEMMKNCWNHQPDQRNSFEQISKVWDKLFRKESRKSMKNDESKSMVKNAETPFQTKIRGTTTTKIGIHQENNGDLLLEGGEKNQNNGKKYNGVVFGESKEIFGVVEPMDEEERALLRRNEELKEVLHKVRSEMRQKVDRLQLNLSLKREELENLEKRNIKKSSEERERD